MKLITFSLWGLNPKYLIGAIKNAQLAKEIYPDWICRFYVGQSVPFSIIHELKSMDNVQIVERAEFGDWKGMFWRFEAISEKDVEVMISRDTDSRLNYREKAAVDEWLQSDKGFHIMRDHPWHNFPVLGGMWGIKSGIVPEMKDLINNFAQEDAYGTDYKFLADIIMPQIKGDILVHDEFFVGNPFPTPRNNYDFVGQVYDENDNVVEEHLNVLRNHLEKSLTQKSVAIYHHLGLGDMIQCNGLIRHYAEKYDRVDVFAKEKYYASCRFMYHDNNRIIVNKISNDNEQKEVKKFLSNYKGEIIMPGHENYFNNINFFDRLDYSCGEAFYYLAKVPWQHRNEKFHFERDLAAEKRVYKKLNPTNEAYIFIHDDISRGFVINVKSELKIIKNDPNESFFNMFTILEKAEEIHCMPSSFLALVDCMYPKTKFGKKMLYNLRNDKIGKNSLIADWIFVT